MQSDPPEKQAVKLQPRHTGFYPVIDMYVFREFMIPFSVLLMAFVIMFLIGDVFNDLEDFLSNKAPMHLVISYFTLKIPGNVRFILPISVLLSCMYTMANFGKHMEVTAMRSSGVSLMRCGASIFAVGFMVTCMLFYFNEKLIPYTEREAVMIIERVAKGDKYVEKRYRMLTYRSPDKERTWLFRSFDKSGNHKEVTMKKHRDDGTLDWDINADVASYTPKGWVFTNATVTAYSKDGLMPKSPQQFPTYSLPLKEAPDNPRDVANAVKEPEELPSWVILELLFKTENMADRCRDVYMTLLFRRLAFPWACVLAVFLGIPLATKNERSGIFMAIITAFVVIVVYQVTTEIFVILGKQGILWPPIAGMAPTLAFFVYGWYNVTRRI